MRAGGGGKVGEEPVDFSFAAKRQVARAETESLVTGFER